MYSPVLVFAIFGAIRGWRTPLYRWCAFGIVAYTVVAANSTDWYAGQSFGTRRLADVMPLFAILLVPAVDAIVGTRWIRVYLGLLALSVFVELLGAAAWPASLWFDTHPNLTMLSVWWHPFDNELTAKLQSPGLALRLTEMVGLLFLSVALGLVTSRTVADVRRARRRR